MADIHKVLVVEDDPVGQIVITGMLKNLGYTAEIASNGVDAVKFLTARAYDLVFMDCLMPGMDGFQATRKIRELEIKENRPQKTTIIALTARAMTGDREQCLAAGMDDYLPKPLEMNELKKLLIKYISE